MPQVSADVITDSKQISGKILEFSGSNEIIIIEGRYASKIEKLAFESIKSAYPQLSDLNSIKETEMPEGILDKENTTIYLIGGSNQNAITKELLSRTDITKEEETISIGVITFITTDDLKKYIVISDKAGYTNLPRIGIEKSPLNKYMPEEYVPVAATAVGAGLVWIWHILFNLIQKVARMSIASKLMKRVKKKELQMKYKGFKIKGVRIKYREWFAIFMSATIFALALSFNYVSDFSASSLFIFVIIGVNCMIYAVRHLVRLTLDKQYNLHTEYTNWIFGAFVTIFTGWLGNIFGMAGYNMSDKEKINKEEGRIAYIVNKVSFLIALIFLTWNTFYPHIIAQMAMNLAIAITMIQMLPMKPFGGRKIYAWKKSRWWLLFIPVLILYVVSQLIV